MKMFGFLERERECAKNGGIPLQRTMGGLKNETI